MKAKKSYRTRLEVLRNHILNTWPTKPKQKLSEKRTSISDKEILDWCEKLQPCIFRPFGEIQWRVYPGVVGMSSQYYGPTLRRAIKAAMKGGAK